VAAKRPQLGKQACKKDRQFVVQRYLHMGLSVKVGAMYTESDLLKRCEGDKMKLARLRTLLDDPTMLEPLGRARCPVRSRAASAVRLSLPQLGPSLKTYVVNLKRRPDRRKHIEKVCHALSLKPVFVEAVDGRAIAAKSGRIDIIKKPGGAVARVLKRDEASCATCVGNGRYEVSWVEHGKRRKVLMSMAPHRVQATKVTPEGYELWGAVGCNLSHQDVLRRFLADKHSDWCLVLEDDATLDMPGMDAMELFKQGMKLVEESCPDWALVYLGGSMASFSTSDGTSESIVKDGERVGDMLVQGHRVYQTHAFIIRKTIAKVILEKLQGGQAADAALANWTRLNRERVFIFKPRMILLQPGAADRWKDSDIFVEGAEFRRQAEEQAQRSGKSYEFAPKLRNKLSNLTSAGADISRICKAKLAKKVKAAAGHRTTPRRKLSATSTQTRRRPAPKFSSKQLKLRAARKRIALPATSLRK